MSLNRFEQLVEHLSAARAPDGRLDQEIANFMGWDSDAPVPRWTASIDAAVTLIPAQTTYGILIGDVGAAAFVAKGAARAGATPAIAVCIAALHHRFNGQEPGAAPETAPQQDEKQ